MTAPHAPLIVPIQQIAGLAYGALVVAAPSLAATGKLNDVAATATAIAMAESVGNTYAHNTNAATGDDSYGLWQINMLGSMGPRRRALFGITTNEKLFDPLTNAQAMAKLYVNKGLKFTDWSTYNSGAYKKFLTQAKDAVAHKKPFGTNAAGEEGMDTVVGGKILDAASAIFSPIFDFIKEIGLRIAGFVGGGVLLILAIVLYVKSSSK